MPPAVPFPPFHPQHSAPLTPAAALTQLAAYLHRSETHAYMHPDALLHAGGINYSANGGPLGGVAMHNLRRIEKGLRGEILAPEPEELGLLGVLDDAGAGDDTVLDESARRYQTKLREDGQPRKSALKRRASEVLVDEWQDGGEYARQQVVLEGEVGERDPAGGDEEGYGGEDGGGVYGERVDKQTRKEDKKKRQKAEKRDKEARKVKG